MRKSRVGWAVDFVAYSAVRILVAVIQAVPLDMGDALCRNLAWLAAGPLKIRHGVTDANLRRVFPAAHAQSRRELSYQMWHHLLLMVCEIAWAQRRLHRCNWSQYVTLPRNRDLLRYLLSDRPTVIVTGHYGNFEIGGYISGVFGFTTLTIARQLDNPFLHRWVERFRGSRGQQMVDKEGCAPVVEKRLSEGGILSLLADQHAGAKGCWVDFLGIPASCHKALALFSLSSEAPMLVGATRRVGSQPMQFEFDWTGVADPKHDSEGVCHSVTSLTRWYNEKLALAIAPGVEQYWWLHRRWRTPPPRVVKRLAKAA